MEHRIERNFAIKQGFRQSMGKTISFHRRYYAYSGGHQKVRDYIDHFLAFNHSVLLYTEGQAETNPNLFSHISRVTTQNEYAPQHAELVFLAGMDWNAYLSTRAEHSTIINLIQHVRHADRQNPLFNFLSKPAIRLCVSETVKNAIQPYANGPCHTINMGIRLPKVEQNKKTDLYILASKQPRLGNAIYSWAHRKGIKTILHSEKQTRNEVINAMANSKVTVALPNETEGFFLPSLEAMYYSDIAIIPYCIVNKEYHHPLSNLVVPEYDEENIKSEILNALTMPKWQLAAKRYIGRKIVKRYSLHSEREALRKVISLYSCLPE